MLASRSVVEFDHKKISQIDHIVHLNELLIPIHIRGEFDLLFPVANVRQSSPLV